jgi:hypothetical protein
MFWPRPGRSHQATWFRASVKLVAMALVSGLAPSSAAASVLQDGHLGVLEDMPVVQDREVLAAQARARTWPDSYVLPDCRTIWQSSAWQAVFKGGDGVVRVLDRDDVRRLVSMADAIAAVREAFAAAARLADEHGAGRDVPLGDW